MDLMEEVGCLCASDRFLGKHFLVRSVGIGVRFADAVVS